MVPMGTSRIWITFLILAAATASVASAQVDVTATGGNPAASYTTLKGAFDAINAGTHKGVITITITSNTTETASAVLNASGVGASSYSGITISPDAAEPTPPGPRARTGPSRRRRPKGAGGAGPLSVPDGLVSTGTRRSGTSQR